MHAGVLHLSDSELEVVLNDLLDVHGYDFTNYSRASLKRRITRLLSFDKFVSFAEFRYRLRSDQEYLQRFIEQVTVNVTEMFRDPSFYKTLREEVLPIVGSSPVIRIWHAGCATGEEVYSMAIMLHEEKLLHKSRLYATDINPTVLETVRTGIFPMNQMQAYSENYNRAGGKRDFSSYYTAQYNVAKFDAQLSSRMILATHNLVSDRSFNEFQIIMCRNVMIYFDKDLQDKVLQLFDESLELFGFLCLGSKETIRFSAMSKKYKQVGKEKIWRKVEK